MKIIFFYFIINVRDDSMDELIRKFSEYMLTIRNYSNNTEVNYIYDLDCYSTYIKKNKIDYKNINYKEINEYIKYLKEKRLYNSRSINRHLSSLRSFYNYLINENIITNNPFKVIKGPKKEKRLPNYMKYFEFEAMVDSCENTNLGIRNRCLLEVLLATGARISEVVNIKINDISLNNHEIKVLGKGNKERIVYFTDLTENVLKTYINDVRPILLKNKSNNYLFINHLGNQLTSRGARDIIDKIILKSSINSKVTPHTFRHTFATMLLNEGCDLKSVQELLGHVNLSTTSIYTHITNARIKDIYLHTHPRERK